MTQPNNNNNNCRLCGSPNPTLISQDERHNRSFYQCPDCGLISVPPQYHLTESEELSRYAQHDNTMSNQGYVNYLSEIVDVVLDAVSGTPQGRISMSDPREQPIKLLDFGCGSEAILCRLLLRRGMGIDCYPYDPLYEEHRRLSASVDKYDVIVVSEVVEHLRDIAGELRLMGKLLRDGGAIILRTQLYEDSGVDKSEFQKWWYAQDPTHINFFNRESLSKLASIIGKRVDETGRRDIFILR
jgi:SAM-dependent methyltransferase